MTRFKAGVQYDDWEGTSAADNADKASLGDYLKSKSLIKDNEFLIAAELYVGENHGDKLGLISIRAFLFDQATADYDSVKDALDSIPDPIPVRIVDMELTLDEFVELFKRFKVSLTRRALNLEGREYNDISEGEN